MRRDGGSSNFTTHFAAWFPVWNERYGRWLDSKNAPGNKSTQG
jgi:hypothetical protein